MKMATAQWPRIFTDPDFSLNGCSRAEVVAMALEGWGLCKAGHEPPSHTVRKRFGRRRKNVSDFGNGMAAIGKFLGFPPLEEALNREADKIIQKARK